MVPFNGDTTVDMSLLVASFVGIFILMISVTLFLRRRAMLSKESAPTISGLLMNVICPALSFSSIARSRIDVSELLAGGLIVTSELLIGVLAYSLGRWVLKLERAALGSFVLATMFGSGALIGNALIKVIFHDNPTMVSMSTIISSLGIGVPINTIGILIALHFGSASSERSPLASMRRFFVEPCMLAIYAGILWLVLGIPQDGLLVETIFGACVMIGAALPFCSAMLVGLTLEIFRIGKSAKILVACVALALVVEPFILKGLLGLYSIDPTVGLIAMLLTAMPSSPLCVVLAVRYGCDAELSSKLVATTLIVSALTLPLIALV